MLHLGPPPSQRWPLAQGPEHPSQPRRPLSPTPSDQKLPLPSLTVPTPSILTFHALLITTPGPRPLPPTAAQGRLSRAFRDLEPTLGGPVTQPRVSNDGEARTSDLLGLHPPPYPDPPPGSVGPLLLCEAAVGSLNWGGGMGPRAGVARCARGGDQAG